MPVRTRIFITAGALCVLMIIAAVVFRISGWPFGSPSDTASPVADAASDHALATASSDNPDASDGTAQDTADTSGTDGSDGTNATLSSINIDTDAGLRLTFETGDLSGWLYNANYLLTADQGVLTVAANKISALESFTYVLDAPLDISACPTARITLMAEKDFILTISLKDADGAIEAVSTVKPLEVVANGRYHSLSTDFSTFKKVDLSRVTEFIFVMNRSSAECDAIAYITEIAFGGVTGAAPNMTAITPQQAPINASPQTVFLRGLLPAIPHQTLSLTAQSNNTDLFDIVSLDYDGGETAQLTWRPRPDAHGTGSATLLLAAEDAAFTTEATFDVVVARHAAPTVNPISDVYAVAGRSTAHILTGLDDGNIYARLKVAVAAESADPGQLPHPIVRYAYGPDEPERDTDGTYDRWATLVFTPDAAARGDIPVTLTLTHDGGVSAGGQDTTHVSFTVHVVGDEADIPPKSDRTGNGSLSSGSNGAAGTAGMAGMDGTDGTAGMAGVNNTGSAAVITGFMDDFTGDAPATAWTQSGEGCHTATYENGALKIAVDKRITNNPWAGLWFQPWEIIDLTNAPFISIRMKTDVSPTDMLIFLWDENDVYNTAQTMKMMVYDEYTEFFFDFTDQLASGGGGEVDLSRIKSLLINFAPGRMFTGTFWFQDFRVGDRVDTTDVPARLRLDTPEDFVIPVNAPEQAITITGIKDGKGNKTPIQLTATCDNPALSQKVSVSSVADGCATLRFTPAKDAVGSGIITVAAGVVGATGATGAAGATGATGATGAETASVSFKLTLAANAANTANTTDDLVTVSLDPGITYQTIDGFGAFMGTGPMSTAMQDLYVAYANDIGMSMARFGIIDVEFEPANTNSNLNATDYSRYNLDALPLALIKRLNEESPVERFVLTLWSPPAWMKLSKAQTAVDSASDNRLAPWFYEAYAGHLAAIIKTVKEHTGVDIYAVSLQNEPQFNEPYASGILLSEAYVELLKVVGRRFAMEQLDTKIFMPEALPAQKGISGYIDAVNNDPEAREYTDIIAIHNYDSDGVRVGGAGTREWTEIYQWTQAPPAKKLWMTETSGHTNDRSGAMILAGNIHNALANGQIGAWLWWSFNATAASEVFGLLVDGAPTARYFTSKHYYKFIRPGDIRIEAVSSSEYILATAFTDPTGEKRTVVLINGGRLPQTVRLTGDGLPEHWVVYETSPNIDFLRRPDLGKEDTLFIPPDGVVTLTTAAVDVSAPQYSKER